MADRRIRSTNDRLTEQLFMLGAIGVAAVVLAVIWIAVHAAAALTGNPPPAKHPLNVLIGIFDDAPGGDWSTVATLIATVEVAAVGSVVWLVFRVIRRSRGKRLRTDAAAAHLATRKDLRHLTAHGASATADRLGVTTTGGADPGVPLGKTVPTGTRLFSSWEDMIVVVAGPRTMKSTAYAIPAIMAAPGAVLATSNKRDVVDATRGPRSNLGRVWVFDPQGVARAAAKWWWNPLTYIAPNDPATGRAARDPQTGEISAAWPRAEKLAGQFCASSIAVGAKTDAYFDQAAEDLIALMLMAAACGEEPITKIYTWLTRPTDDTPIDLLRKEGFVGLAESLYGVASLAEKQRDGVYGTARARVGFLRNKNMVTWITPPPTVGGKQFHPVEFATSTDTLYPLSKEGEGSAGPLVAALTVAVVDALEDAATESPGGRLIVPFLAVLDEAANICRFRRLEDYYSHFGSRGIIIITILQNWAQGEEVWGVRGMEKLWSAANVKVYGGGVDDDKFLRRLSDLIGTHTHVTRSESVSGGRSGRGVSVSSSVQERTILTIGELREMPQGRAIVFASGTPAVLIEPQPWFKDRHVAVIEESLALHSPGSKPAPSPQSAAVSWQVAGFADE